MKKKTRKYIIISGIAFLVVIILLALLCFGGLFNSTPQSIINLLDSNGILLPPENGTFNFANVQGSFETVKLGCADENSVKGISGGNINFCNSLDSENELKLSSSLSASDCTQGTSGSSCVKENYIQSKITLPAGTYDITYDYALTDINDMDGSNIAFTIDNFSYSQRVTNSLADSKTYAFTLNSPKEIIFRIDTGIRAYGGSSTGNMRIDFTPAPPKSDYYRFANNTCTKVTIPTSEKTENDYLTPSECENNIVHPISWLLFIAIGLIVVFIITIILLKLKRKK